MVGRLLPGSAGRTFRSAVFRQQSPDLVSRSLAAELLADQDQPYALDQILSRVQQVHDLGRYGVYQIYIRGVLDGKFY